jgi:hypothetical protein
MTADVTFVTDESKECVYISRKAIVEENGKQYVYKKSGDSYVLSPVETGFTNGANIEIVSGIEEGENYYIASVVVNETDEETSDNQESETSDGSKSDGMDMQQPNGDMSMPTDMNNMNGGSGMRGGAPQ